MTVARCRRCSSREPVGRRPLEKLSAVSRTPDPTSSSPHAHPAAGDRPDDRDAGVHFVLAGGGDRALRHGVDGVLHRRHRRAGDRQGGALVHPRRDAVRLRGARRLHRVVRHVRPRRRLPRRQGGDGRHARQALGLGADVRLRADRPDQRRVGRPVHRRPDQRPARRCCTSPFTLPPGAASAADRRRASRSTSGARTSSASRSRATRR